MKKMPKNMQKEVVKKMLKKRGVSEDELDIVANLDSTLTLPENINNNEELKRVLKKKPKYNEAEHKEIEKQDRLNEQKDAKKKFEKSLRAIRDSTSVELDKYFGDIKKLIKAVIISPDIHSLILESGAGLGKTFTTTETLVGLKKDFKLLRGHYSPMELYHELWKYQNSIIVLDDPSELLKDPTCRRILMSASWSPTNIRRVEWGSTTPRLEAPPFFNFAGKLIYLVNQLPDEFGTLKSRSFHYKFNFDFSTKLKIATEIAKIKKISFDKIDWIETNKFYNFDFRDPIKLKNLGAEWKRLGSKIMEADYRLILMAELIDTKLLVKEQVRDWCERTGQSRANFFILKAKYFPNVNR